MAQKVCEICQDPLPIDARGVFCDDCQQTIDVATQGIEDGEADCERPNASAEATSSSATPSVTRGPVVASTSSNTAALNAADGILAALLGRKVETVNVAPTSEVGRQLAASLEAIPDQPEAAVSADKPDADPPEVPIKPMRESSLKFKVEVGDACEGCGLETKALERIMTPNGPATFCPACRAEEVALGKSVDDPMQGKVVAPDEAQRQEIKDMDREEYEIFNAYCLINADTPLVEVQKRIDLLNNRIRRTKAALLASSKMLVSRRQFAEQKEVDELHDLQDKRYRTRKAQLAAESKGVQGEAKKARAKPRSKAQAFRDTMSAVGMPESWIADQIKLQGLE